MSPLATQLSWSHFIELLPLQKSEARYFYAVKANEATWSSNELRRQIERKAYERNEIASLQVADDIAEIKNSFKDPYFFDFFRIKRGLLRKGSGSRNH